MKLVAIACLAAACGSAPPPAAAPSTTGLSNTAAPEALGAHELVASLERTACFGSCPIYKVTVYGDGAIDWEGEQFVKVVGHATGRATPDQLSRLRAAFVHAGFTSFKSAYDHETITDQPGAEVSFRDGSRTRTVVHHDGDRSAPPSLSLLEDQIDDILETTRWIGTDKERGR
jgi:hypothetical protein